MRKNSSMSGILRLDARGTAASPACAVLLIGLLVTVRAVVTGAEGGYCSRLLGRARIMAPMRRRAHRIRPAPVRRRRARSAISSTACGRGRVDNVLVCARGGALAAAGRDRCRVIELPMRGDFDLALHPAAAPSAARRRAGPRPRALAARCGAGYGGIAAARARERPGRPHPPRRRRRALRGSPGSKYRPVCASSSRCRARSRRSSCGAASSPIAWCGSERRGPGSALEPDPVAGAPCSRSSACPRTPARRRAWRSSSRARATELLLDEPAGDRAPACPASRVLFFGRGPLEPAAPRDRRAPGLGGYVVLAGFRADLPALLRASTCWCTRRCARGSASRCSRPQLRACRSSRSAAGGVVERSTTAARVTRSRTGDGAGIASPRSSALVGARTARAARGAARASASSGASRSRDWSPRT